jgi:hypothetical protein
LGNTLKVRVTALPERGKANLALEATIAEALGISTDSGLRDLIVKSLVIPEPEPETPPKGAGLWVKHEAFDPVASLERIRFLAEELVRSETDVQKARGLMDAIHRHLDALKRHLA